MSDIANTQGKRIRSIFENAKSGVIIAPFIKMDALQSLLKVIPADIPLRCVTRWLPKEIAAGVSDPEILDILEERGKFTLSLVDRLHAKLYIADDRCLAGSANVTLAGLGESGQAGNIEILLETNIHNPVIVATLDEINRVEYPANRTMALVARHLANSIFASERLMINENGWFPVSHQPEHAFQLYKESPEGYIRTTDQLLLHDLGCANLQPGMQEKEFNTEIRSLLATIPITKIILDETRDKVFTCADVFSYLEAISGEEFSIHDLWRSFVNWMVYFFSDQLIRQEITEVALRRAQFIGQQ